MKQILFSTFLAVALATPLMAEERNCAKAGPQAEFCANGQFARLDEGATPGSSLWMYRGGYLSKVLVESLADAHAKRATIEARIMALVSRQAVEVGRRFEFSDMTSATLGGAPFGTLSYTLAGEDGDSVILHSYVAVEGKVAQVISQVALKRADRDPDALRAAHDAALSAVRLRPQPDPET